jgi:hypothetical protein
MILSFPHEGLYGYWNQPTSSGEERDYYLLLGRFLHRQIYISKIRISSIHIPQAMTDMRAPPSLLQVSGNSKTNFFKTLRGEL